MNSITVFCVLIALFISCCMSATATIGITPKYAGTCVAEAGSKTWITPTNAQGTTDDVVTTTGSINAISNLLTCTNFGITMDSGATIQGLSVSLRKSASKTAGDSLIILWNGALQIGNDHKNLLQWPIGSLADFPYGGPADNWAGSLTEGVVTSSGFGIVIQGEAQGSQTTLSVDSVSMRLFFDLTWTVSSFAPLSEQEGSTITVTLNKVYETPEMACKFETSVVSATYVSPTEVSCVVPINPLEGISSSVTLQVTFDGSTYATAATNFTYIGCSAYTSCQSCANVSDTLDCRWCSEAYECISTALPCISGPSSIDGSCPTLSYVSPNTVLGEDQQSVDIFGTDLFAATCDFNGYTATPSSLIGIGQVRCSTPPDFPASTGMTTLQLIHPTNLNPVVENSLNFSFFDCSTYSNTDCGTCMSAPHDMCGWCLDTNTCYNPSTFGSCAGTLTQNGVCPTLSAATPGVLAVGVGGTISVSGSLFVPGIDCKFGTFSTVAATVLSSNSLTCTVGSNPAPGSEPISLLNSGIAYSPDSLSFKWSTCSSETTCSGCINSLPDCGWCYESQNCTSLPQCDALGNAWSTLQCPTVTSISPPLEEISGESTLTVQGTGFLNSLSDNFECRWGSTNPSAANKTVATRISSTLLQCPSISASTNASLPLYIGLNTSSQEYTESPYGLNYVDCPTSSDCQSCRDNGNPACVWCLNTNECTLDHQCVPVGTPKPISAGELGSGTDSGVICPSVQDPVPSTVVADKIVTLFISSSVYLESDSTYSCSWSCSSFSGETPAQVANSTWISCDSPVFSKGDIAGFTYPLICGLQIKHGGFLHSTSSLDFYLEEPPKISPATPDEDDTGAIVMGSIAGVLVVGLASGFFVYKRKLADALPALDIDIPDPKLAVLGSFATPKFDMNSARVKIGENLLEVATRNVPWAVVYNPESDVALPTLEFPLLAAMCYAINISSADKLTNSLSWLLMEKKLIVDYMKAQIVRELEDVPTDDMINARGSLFRTNSFATKVWQPFAREIFLPYIFRCVVPTIYQICNDNPYTEEELAEMDPKSVNKGTSRIKAKKSGVSLSTGAATEIDPNRLKVGQSDGVFIANAQLQLQLHCQNILTNLFRGTEYLHPAGREVLHFLSEAVGSFFPGSENNVLSGFFFLRLLCPILITAENWGLTPGNKPPSEAARRTLILAVKIIQTLANGVLFGVKENFMISFNDWIERNRPFLDTFFDKLAEANEPGIDIYQDHDIDTEGVTSPWELEPAIHNEFLAYFINALFYMKKLIPTLETKFPGQPIIIGPIKADYTRFHVAIGERVPKLPSKSK